jgi:tetratricopeptide (TPR) repeat protein
MAHYQRALDIKPDYAEAHRNLANTLLAFDRNEEPIAHYERSLATKPAAAGSTTRRRPSHPRAVRGRSPQQARPTRRVLAPVRPRAGQTGVGVIGQKGPPEAQRARTTKQYNCFHNPVPPREFHWASSVRRDRHRTRTGDTQRSPIGQTIDRLAGRLQAVLDFG